MAKSRKKHEILGGIKVSSQQLSEWGKSGGRPQKWTSEAERKRAERLRKKQEKFGQEAQLAERKIYEKVQISKYLTCPNCRKVEKDYHHYFNPKGEFIPESYFFDTVRMEKINIRENKFSCHHCYQSFSFLTGKVAVNEVRKVEKRAGSGKERVKKFRGVSI